jgi:hypothetical protein
MTTGAAMPLDPIREVGAFPRNIVSSSGDGPMSLMGHRYPMRCARYVRLTPDTDERRTIWDTSNVPISDTRHVTTLAHDIEDLSHD